MLSKTSSITVRASAALPAAGAYDSGGTLVTIPVGDAREVELFVAYTRGGAGGAFKLKVLTSDDGTTFAERTVEDGSSLSAGAMNVYTAEHKFPVAAGAALERRSFIVPTTTAKWIQVAFAEYGATATPGTLAATCVAAV